MTDFCNPNIFNDCDIDELIILYNESKKYTHFAEIDEDNVLHKYVVKFVEVSIFKSYSVFCLNLVRAYADKLTLDYIETMRSKSK